MKEKILLPYQTAIQKQQRKKRLLLLLLLVVFLLLAFFSLFFGSSSLSFRDSLLALFGIGEKVNVRIMQRIRIPRVLAGIVAGIGLSISGLIMQTCLGNPMASPATLGVSNAAVLGANVTIVLLSGGNLAFKGQEWNSFNPYLVSTIAFLFSLGAIIVVLALSKLRHFSSETLVLTGVSLSSLFSAVTTLLQYFATDTELSGAVYWSFGDLGRVTYRQIVIMAIAVAVSYIVFTVFRSQLNALSLGESAARTGGVNTEFLRFLLLALSSLVTACCISFLGVIGFIGLICPHVARRMVSEDHRYLLPSSALCGGILLLFSDDVARVILKGFSLPVGAITALIGAPFFLFLIFASQRRKEHA